MIIAMISFFWFYLKVQEIDFGFKVFCQINVNLILFSKFSSVTSLKKVEVIVSLQGCYWLEDRLFITFDPSRREDSVGNLGRSVFSLRCCNCTSMHWRMGKTNPQATFSILIVPCNILQGIKTCLCYQYTNNVYELWKKFHYLKLHITLFSKKLLIDHMHFFITSCFLLN